MGGAMVGLGVAFIVLTFLLAFTIFGEIAALLGVLCIATGAILMSRRPREPRAH